MKQPLSIEDTGMVQGCRAFAPPFRAFAYTLVHLVFVLCLKKESSP